MPIKKKKSFESIISSLHKKAFFACIPERVVDVEVEEEEAGLMEAVDKRIKLTLRQ